MTKLTPEDKALQDKLMDLVAENPIFRDLHRDDNGGVSFGANLNKQQARKLFGDEVWFANKMWVNHPDEPLTEDERKYSQ